MQNNQLEAINEEDEISERNRKNTLLNKNQQKNQAKNKTSSGLLSKQSSSIQKSARQQVDSFR